MWTRAALQGLLNALGAFVNKNVFVALEPVFCDNLLTFILPFMRALPCHMD